jgi:hypothetical protein
MVDTPIIIIHISFAVALGFLFTLMIFGSEIRHFQKHGEEAALCVIKSNGFWQLLSF